MDDDEFQAFLDSSYDDLEKKQSYLENEFGLGHFDRYDLEPENEQIIFSSSDGKRVQANFIPIGTFSPESGSWMMRWTPQVESASQCAIIVVSKLNKLTRGVQDERYPNRN